jgi:hypothetical protein
MNDLPSCTNKVTSDCLPRFCLFVCLRVAGTLIEDRPNSVIQNISEITVFLYRYRQWKKYYDGRKTHDRTRWLNSPNVYQKVEILETGTPDPKKITKVEMITFENKTESK